MMVGDHWNEYPASTRVKLAKVMLTSSRKGMWTRLVVHPSICKGFHHWNDQVPEFQPIGSLRPSTVFLGLNIAVVQWVNN